MPYRLYPARRRRLPLDSRQHDRKDVGTDAREFARGYAACQALGQLPEQRVACRAAQRVVHRPETLYVGKDQCDLVPGGARRMYVLVQALQEQGAIGKARKLIVVGKVVELVRLFDMIEGERDVPRQLVQQLHLLVIEEPDFPGI